MLHIFVSSISFPTHRKNYFPLSLNFAEGWNSGLGLYKQCIKFAKFLNSWFVSWLSKVWEVWLMHSRTHFKLAAWGTEKYFLDISRWSRYRGQKMKRRKDKWRAIITSGPPTVYLIDELSNRVCVCVCVLGIVMRIILHTDALTSDQLWQKRLSPWSKIETWGINAQSLCAYVCVVWERQGTGREFSHSHFSLSGNCIRPK